MSKGAAGRVVNAGLFQRMSELFVSLPHASALGLRFVGIAQQKPSLMLDWRDDLVGNPASGVLHGGVITSLIDSCSALAVMARLPDPEAIATLDLRIDYLRAAVPGQPIFCTAECYRLASQVAFTRAVCFHDTIDQPVAHGVATFMRESSPVPMTGGAQHG